MWRFLSVTISFVLLREVNQGLSKKSTSMHHLLRRPVERRPRLTTYKRTCTGLSRLSQPEASHEIRVGFVSLHTSRAIPLSRPLARKLGRIDASDCAINLALIDVVGTTRRFGLCARHAKKRALVEFDSKRRAT